MDEYDTLSNAILDIGATEVTLIVKSQITLHSSCVIPENIHLKIVKGGSIVTTGYTLTINGSFSCGLFQAFSGTGTVIFGKISSRLVYPEWWGNNSIPGTTNMSDEFNSAISSIENLGGTILLHPTIYCIEDVELKSFVNIKGSGHNTILKKETTGSYIFTCDSGSSNINDNIENITISNICFEGLSVDVGFSEHRHLININGVSNVLIESCKLCEYEGDGIYIGSSNSAATERHNLNIIIRLCIFDGVNKENRNAISIIDGTNILIENNTFLRSTKSTMPGAIDIEPDSNVFAIIRHITIRNNYLNDIGGNTGAISLVLPLSQNLLTNSSKNITIENNRIYNVSGNAMAFTQTGIVDSASDSNMITIYNNHIDTANKAFEFLGIKGISINSNTFENVLNPSYIGYTAVDDKCFDVIISNNNFIKCGTIITTGGYGLIIYEVDHLIIENNVFNDCGKEDATFGYAIDFEIGSSNNILILNNKFISPNSYTTRAIVREASHTFNPSTNFIDGNDFNNIALLNMDNFDTPLLVGATPSVKSLKNTISYYECNNAIATEITQFENGERNKIIVVRIDVNTTIKNNANIFLAGGADFSGDANDIITLVCVATDEWREVSRSIN
jgi:hypothetical protein